MNTERISYSESYIFIYNTQNKLINYFLNPIKIDYLINDTIFGEKIPNKVFDSEFHKYLIFKEVKKTNNIKDYKKYWYEKGKVLIDIDYIGENKVKIKYGLTNQHYDYFSTQSRNNDTLILNKHYCYESLKIDTINISNFDITGFHITSKYLHSKPKRFLNYTYYEFEGQKIDYIYKLSHMFNKKIKRNLEKYIILDPKLYLKYYNQILNRNNN